MKKAPKEIIYVEVKRGRMEPLSKTKRKRKNAKSA
jgi:hypothetical protein